MTDVNPRDLVTAAAYLSGYTTDDIIGPSRTIPLAAWRQATMTAIRQECAWSTPSIGRMFDGRHHTTVLAAIERCATDGARRRMVERITAAAGQPHPHLRIINGGAA